MLLDEWSGEAIISEQLVNGPHEQSSDVGEMKLMVREKNEGINTFRTAWPGEFHIL